MNDTELAKYARERLASWTDAAGPGREDPRMVDIAWGLMVTDVRKVIERAQAASDPESLALVKKLRCEVDEARRNNERRNVELDALHYVWCDGGCRSGIHRYCHGEPLTEAIVSAAEVTVGRMRRWLSHHKYRGRRFTLPPASGSRAEPDCG